MGKQVPWLSAIVILVIIFAALYGVAQQVQRNAADSPQIELAQSTAASLKASVSPKTLTPGHVNLTTSLAPFINIYSSSGRVVSGSGYLHSTIPQPPFGILSAARGKAYYRVTWEPENGIRIAAVSVSAGKYYVVSGRSLKLVEENESHSFDIAFAAGLFALIILLVSWVIYNNSLRA